MHEREEEVAASQMLGNQGKGVWFFEMKATYRIDTYIVNIKCKMKCCRYGGDKGNKFSSYKFSRGSAKKVPRGSNSKRGGSGSSRGGSSASRSGSSASGGSFGGGGLGFMPAPQPRRAFLGATGGTFFGW